jgi:pimeloyl-ACP methyl ester carboxylesterase
MFYPIVMLAFVAGVKAMTDTETGKTTLLTINDRLSLRYQQTGSGPPMVLLHTIRGQLEYFRDLVPRLAERYTIYAVDMPGHGHSPIDRSANFEEPYFRGAIVSFIERLDLRNVTLVGESIGAVVALTVAAAIPDRIRAVFALNTYDYETRYADGVRRGNLLANVAMGSFAVPILGSISAALENRFILQQVLGGGFYDPRKLPDDIVAEFDRVGRRPGYRWLERKVLAGWRSWGAARAQYANVRAPVTLIYGQNDWSHPAERQRTVQAIPNARALTLPGDRSFLCAGTVARDRRHHPPRRGSEW